MKPEAKREIAATFGWAALIGIAVLVAGVLGLNEYCPAREDGLNLNWRISPQLDEQKQISPGPDNRNPGDEPVNSSSSSHGLFSDYKIMQAPLSGEQKQNENNKTSWLEKFLCDFKISDAIIGFFTYCLVIVTWELARITNRLWDAGERQLTLTRIAARIQARQTLRSLAISKSAADAATKAASAAVAVELPRIMVSTEVEIIPGSLSEYKVIHGVPTEAVITIDGFNIGRTPAMVTKYGIGFNVGTALPDIPKYEETYTCPVPSEVAPEKHIKIAKPASFTKEVVDLIFDKKCALFVYGFFDYTDFAGGNHTVRYCFIGSIIEGAGRPMSFSVWDQAPAAYIGGT